MFDAKNGRELGAQGFRITGQSERGSCDGFVTRGVYFPTMPLDRSLVTPDATGARLELVPEPQAPQRPSLRVIEQPGRTPAANGIGDIVPTDLRRARALPQPRADLARIQPPGPARGRGRSAHAAARAAEVHRDRQLQPRRVLHEADRRPQAAGRRRAPRADTPDGRTPQQQIDDCLAVITRARDAQDGRSSTQLRELLRAARTSCSPRTTSSTRSEQREASANYYLDNIFPLVTPQAIDPAHPFPFISNLSLNLLVTLRYPERRSSRCSRGSRCPVGARHPAVPPGRARATFVRLEDVMAHNLDLPVPGHGDRSLRALPGDPQRQHRARRGGSGRPARR